MLIFDEFAVWTTAQFSTFFGLLFPTLDALMMSNFNVNGFLCSLLYHRAPCF